MAKPDLKIIKATHRVVDITALLRADIAKIDWDAVHIRAGRRDPVDIPETRKGWRA